MSKNTFDPTKPVVVSPGPTSIEGKAISSRNSLKHGCCADDTLLLKTENITDYNALKAIWFQSYSPKDEAERHLIQELINADWFLQRSTRTVASVEAELLDAEPNPLHWTDQQQKTFGRFLRYQTARANTVKRCQKAVEDYRKARLSEKLSEQKLVTVQTRLKVVEQKNKPEPTWKEHLAGMRQKAIDLGYVTPDGQPTGKK
jgi:hypothetical protein